MLAENEADAREQLSESCVCGVRLNDHYRWNGTWRECADGGRAVVREEERRCRELLGYEDDMLDAVINMEVRS